MSHHQSVEGASGRKDFMTCDFMALGVAAGDVPGALEQEEDAPQGHPAYSRVRFCDHPQGHLYHFKYGDEHFQVTLGRACNSAAHAARIARLCYLRFEAGDSKEDVKAFRDRLLRELAARWDTNKDASHEREGGAQRPAKRRKRLDGAVGTTWASQLGSRFSKMKKLMDPFADI
uniref:Uncharacterized protein n=1 Tax=Pyrodinium bahamense TaxID=73915 RepID=A0A7S0FAH3_9DINO